MIVLALDGALARSSAALWRDGEVLAAARVDAPRGQPVHLPALARQVLAGGGGRPDVVAVGIGPGGFTGLRAAIALATGLAEGWGVALHGVTTGEALAAALGEAGRDVWSATDTKRGRLILERPGHPPEMLDEASLPRPDGPVLLVGDAAPLAAARLAALGADARLSELRLPDAPFVAAAAARRLAAGLPPHPAAPLYVEPVAIRGA